MSTVKIPLVAGQQTLTTNLNGVQYRLRVAWNPVSECWLLDMLDSSGVPILQGVALTAGVDLLGQFEYLGLGGHMVARTDSNPNLPPSFDNLGGDGSLYFIQP